MKDKHKTKAQLIDELDALRHRVVELEVSETECKQAEAAEKLRQEALRQHAKRLEILHDIDQAILAAQSAEAIARATLDHIPQLLPCYRASVLEFDPDTQEGTMLAIQVSGQTKIGPGARLSPESFRFYEKLRQGQVNLVEDASTLAQPSPAVQTLLAEGVRSYINVPLMAEGKLIGTLNLGADRPNTFRAGHIQIAREVAGPLAIGIHQARLYEQVESQAITLEQRVAERTVELMQANAQLRQEIVERKRAEEALRQRTAQLEALREVGLELTTELDLDSLLHSIVSQATELLGGAAGGLYLYRPERDVLELVMATGAVQGSIGAVLEPGEGLSGQVWQSGEPLTVDNYQQWAGRSATFEDLPIAAIVGVPIYWDRQFLGVLNVANPPDTPRTFSPTDAELLSMFATQTAAAIRNARLVRSLRESEARYRSLFEDSPISLWEVDLSGIKIHLDDLCSQGIKDFRPYFEQHPEAVAQCAAMVKIIDVNQATLELYQAGSKEEFLDGFSRIFVAETYDTFREQFIAVAEGRTKSEGEAVNQTLKGDKKYSVFRWSAAPGYEETWSKVLVSVIDTTEYKRAEEERGQLLAAEREQRLLAETLTEVSLVLTSQISHTAVLDEILRQMQRLVPYKTANIMLLEDDTLHIARWRGYGTFGSQELISNLVQPLADFPVDAEVIQIRKPVVIPDSLQEPRWVWLDETAWIRSNLIVPICLRDRVLGLLRLDDDTPGNFSAEDAERLQPLANAAAIALENARLFERAQQEISERKQAEQALRVSEERYTLAVQAGRVGIWAWDPATDEFYIAPNLKAMLGYEDHKIRNHIDDWSKLVHPDDVERVMAELTALLEGLRSECEIEHRMRRQDGTVRCFLTRGSAIQDGNGEAAYIMGTETDITERKQAQERLEQRNRELALLNRVNQAFISTRDLDQVLATVLEEMRQLLGVVACSAWLIDSQTHSPEAGPGELVCRQVTDPHSEIVRGWRLAPGEGLAGWVAQNGVSLNVPDVWLDRRHFKGVDKQTGLPLRSILSVPLRVKETIIGVLQVVDETVNRFDAKDQALLESLAATTAIAIENARLYEQAQRQTEELEELVQSRTARIQELERQRTESEKLAATGRMAARIAHEINNPLAGIKNSFLLIKDAIPEDHRYYKYVGRIEHEIERIARIVRQMFELHRPDQESAREFPVDETIRDVVALLEAGRRQHRGTIEVDTGPAPVSVTAAEGLLRQVLYNLIQNSIEASPPDGVIKVAATVAEGCLSITVSDQGYGIPEEVRPQIFEPFFTTKSDRPRAGLGLGLSVSKSIVEAMGGSLDFESDINQRTTFWINLPLHGERKEKPNG